MTDQDHRVQCIACNHYRAGWCCNALAAKLSLRQPEKEVGKPFAVMKQDCKGFAPLKGQR